MVVLEVAGIFFQIVINYSTILAVLPLAEAGKREHTGMNHGWKQYGALVL